MKEKTTFLAKASMMLFAVLFSFTARAQKTLTVYEGTQTSRTIPAYTYYFDDFTKSQFVIPADALAEMNGSTISQITFYTTSDNMPYTTLSEVDLYLMEVDYTTISTFEPKESATIAYHGTLNFVAQMGGGLLTIELDTPFKYEGGNLLVGLENTTDAEYKSVYYYGQEAEGASIYGANGTSLEAITTANQQNFIPKTTFTYVEGDVIIVPRPTGLKVSYEGGTEATVSWSSEEDLFDIDVNGTVTEGVENPYTLTGLESLTTYTIKVRAKRDGEVSSWSDPVSFTTKFDGSTCQIQLVLNDSYGDGWSGNAIVVSDVLSGTVFGNYTLTSGDTETFIIEVPDERDIQFSWVAGSWSDECSYAAYDVNEIEIFSGSGALSAPVTYTVNCTIHPWRTPTDLAALAGPTSAELSWTENSLTPATSWVIAYMAEGDEDLSYALAESNPFTLEGLTPGTTYYAMVSPYNEDEILAWSDAITFSTPSYADAKPFNLSVKPNLTTADVSWKGFAESYDIEWAEAESVSSAALQYDNGTLKSQVGNSTPSMWTWGVMYPAETLEGNSTLTKVTFYEAENSAYYYGNVTINVYSGGDTAPGTLIGSETITTTGTNGMREVVLSTPIEIDPTQNLWITLTAAATYCLSMSEQDGGANSRWFLNDDTWVDFGTLYTNGATYSFMIRGLVETINYSEWISETNVTSPFTINGLDAETQYAVKVKGHYGSNGDSNWAMTFFTTPSGAEAPTDLIADAKATTATLDWSGYQESYNLQYRKSTAAPTDPATIILEADDVWQDGSGYQLLLDADANAYGTLWDANHHILVDGVQYQGGDLPTGYYDEFEYKVPANADGALSTTNVVVTGSVTITIPAGTYDYAILNPTPGDKFYIAADNGEVGGAENDFVFEPGKTYRFTMQIFGAGDGAALEITQPMGEWTVVENVTAPYELTGLTPETYYEWQVQGNLTEGTTEWSEISNFTTGEAPYVLEDMQEGSMNDALLEELNGSTVNIQLADRVLYKDGTWNTICLPFDMDAAAIANSALAGADIRTLDNVTLEGESVTLNFTAEGAITAIEAGKPYIIKWAEGGTNTVSPIFEGVTIENVFNPIECTVTGAEAASITFKGTYDLYEFYDDDPSVLFVGENNQLNYPLAGAKIGACRGYFQLTGLSATGEENGVKQFILNFGDDATGIATISKQNAEGNWYDLSGRKVSNLNQKGIYVTEGRKVTVK